MIRKLASIMGLGDRSVSQPAVPEFTAESTSNRALGMEILRGTPGRRNHHQGIRDSLTSMTKEEKDELVDRILARLALFVFDLPASERNHHARRFGLLDHLLEVAYRTARELSGPGFQVSPEVSVQHREGPLWVYAGVIAAILHDLGKALDLGVIAPGVPEPWDPKAEPLRLFCLRQGLAETRRELWYFHPGRGMRSHEGQIRDVFLLVLTSEVEQYLGPRLASILDRLTSQEGWVGTARAGDPACQVIKIMRRCDQESGAEDRGGIPSGPVPTPVLARGPIEKPPPHAEECRVPTAAPEPAVQGELWPLEPSAVAGPLPDPEPVLQAPTPLQLVAPFDFWAEPVPKVSVRKGDPVERERRLATYLDPARLLDTLRRMIVQCRLDRNGLYSDVYLRPDYLWLVLPGAFRRTALINQLPFDTGVLGRMLRSLGSSPHAEPGSEGELTLFMRPRPESRVFKAVRLRTVGFLTEAELAQLGIHAFDIKVVPVPQVPEGSCGGR